MIALTDQRIQKYLTPYRYPEPVLHGSGKKGAFDEKAVDIPFVFRHRGQFYMLYTGFDGIGYQSALAVSQDLLHWEHKGVILKRREDGCRWDRFGGAATWMIKESDQLYDLPRLRKVDGKYWMVYHSYPGTGYENGPAQIGLAWTEDEELLDWHFPDRPCFSWEDGDDWEAGGLYKACIVREGNLWYLFYNAKNREARWTEQTGVAFSEDLEHWTRYKKNPVLRVNRQSWDERFVSDPCVLKDGETWVNFYFGYGKLYEDGHTHAQEGLALSKNLLCWEKVEEPILRYGAPGSIDSGHVHKASVLYWNGVLYHFYCATRPWQEKDPTNAYGEYRSICLAASRDPYGHILPFLWMKGEENEVIREELERIRECGIRQVCLESRPHPDFCGPGWWKNVDFVLREARKHAMRVWILDDDKFPTGHANGGFRRQPDKQKLYLAERHMDVYGPCRNGAVLVKNFLGSDGKLLGILAFPKPDGETLGVEPEGMIDLTDRYRNGFVYFDLPRGPFRLFVLFTTRKGGGREEYMNLIDPESVGVLIREVYEKHYEHYREYFGNTLAGFFSDEPELGNVGGYPFDDTLGKRDQRLPWSEPLEARLRECWGEGFLSGLPALWYPCGDGTRAVRSVYMDQLTRLVRECFSGQIGEWCRTHGVEYIGHVIEDDNAHARMGCSIGHYFREMEGQHMAGVDVVHHQIVPGFTEPVHQWIAGDRDGEFFHFGLAKLASSAAHIQPNKKGRALCELFGNYGWAEGNSLMKWLTDHMLVRGINYFTPHAFSMSDPDRDCPPHFYARGNHPGFACFRQLMQYMNRAAEFLSQGSPVVHAAVLYHGEAEWSGEERMLFQKPGRVLMEASLDYDVVPADLFDREDTRVSDGKLFAGQMCYPCLILPYAGCLDPRVVDFVVKWGKRTGADGAEDGLPVLMLESLPESDTLGGEIPEAFAGKVKLTTLAETAAEVKKILSARQEVFSARQEAAEPWNILSLENPRTAGENFRAEGDRPPMAGERPHRGGESPHDDRTAGLRVMIRLLPEGDMLGMYFNENVNESICKEIRFPQETFDRVTVYDLWDQKELTCRTECGKLPLNLDPGETLYLKFGRRKSFENLGLLSERADARETELPAFPVLRKRIPLEPDWMVFRAETPDFQPADEIVKTLSADQVWETGAGKRIFKPFLKLRKGGEMPNLNGPDYDPGYTGCYRYVGTWEMEKQEDFLFVLCLPEASDCVRVELNGTDLGYLAGFPARKEITETLRNGENRLILDVYTTLVWERKDGASTHLQIPATGITREPVIEIFSK